MVLPSLTRIFASAVLSFVLAGCGVNFFEPVESTIATPSSTPTSPTSSSSVTTAQVAMEWTHLIQAQSFSNPNSFSSTHSQTVVNASGQAIIVWQQTIGSSNQIFKAERAADGTWSLPANVADNISPDGNSVSNSPEVALNDLGQAVITWIQYDSANNAQVFKAERAADGTWSVPANLSDNISVDGQNVDTVHIALNASGQAIITWSQVDGAFYQIYKAERAAVGTWSVPADLTDNISVDGQSAAEPRVSLNPSGQVIITWRQSDGSNSQIFKAERAANGTWTTPANLADNLSVDGQVAAEPQIVLNTSGQAIITWRQSNGSESQIFKAERAINGTWTVPADLNDNISPNSYDATLAQVALNTAGEAVITWQQSDGSNYSVFKAERAANGTWTVPVFILDNISIDGRDAFSPQVALNASGQAIIVWSQHDGTLLQTFKAERASNGTWSLPSGLNDNISPGGQSAITAQVSLNDSGQSIVTWLQSDGRATQVFKAERAANGTWSLPADMSDNISPEGHDASVPQVAINTSGQAVLVWLQKNGAEDQVFKAERASDGTWTLPTSLTDNISPDGQDAGMLQVAFNDSGQAIVTWRQSDGTDWQIFKAERAANGTWTIPANLADNISVDGSESRSPQIAINGTGEAVLTWYQSDWTDWQVFKAERASNGTWTVPTNLADNISEDGQSARDPQVAINSTGQAVLTWYQMDGVSQQIFKAERAANGIWSLPANVADNISPDGQDAYGPQVAFNDSGQTVIAWYQLDGSKDQVFKAERASNGSWSVPANLSDNVSPDGQSASEVRIALNSSGQAVITWTQSDGTTKQIFKAERAATGTWSVPSSLTDNISVDGQNASMSQVAFNDSGQAVIAWIQPEGTNIQIFKAERASSGSWTLPTTGIFTNQNPWPVGIGSVAIKMNAGGEALMGYTSGTDGAAVSTGR